MLSHDVTDITTGSYSLLRFYLGAYENLKSEKRTLEKAKTVPKLFVPPVAPSRSHRDIRGYRLCFNVGAVEFYRSSGTHQKIASAGYIRTLPSLSQLSKGWSAAFEGIRNFQNRCIVPGPSTRFRVTVLGVRGSQLPETFTSRFVASSIGQGIRDKFGWTVDLEDYDVEVVATVLMSATGSRTVGVLSLGLTLCRASYTETMAGLLASQLTAKVTDNKHTTLEHLNNPKSFTEASGVYMIRQMLDIAEKLHEPRASWCLVRRAVKSDQFRRKFLNATNKRGETPLILAAKACDARLVSLILQLGKPKMKEIKEIKLPQNGTRFRPTRFDLMRQDSRKYDALMYSCEKGDNSTISILLQHKTGAFNWGFNKLCERCLTVAATASQPHSLNLLLHHLATTKGVTPPPSLCWPALRAAVVGGHSLTVALILDYMRILADKHKASQMKATSSTSTSKDKDKDSTRRVSPISQDIVTALFSRATAPTRSPSLSPIPFSSASSPSPQSISVVHLLLRAHAHVSGGNSEDIPLFNFLPDDMKSEVKVLRFGTCPPSDGIPTSACSDSKEDTDFDNESECKPQPFPLSRTAFVEPQPRQCDLETLDVDLDVDLDIGEKGKEKEKPTNGAFPTKQRRTRVLGRGLLPFQLYEQEKQLWLASLLSLFQPAASSLLLCSSTVQIILNYLVV